MQMLNETKIDEFGKTDGILSALHCEDEFFIRHVFNIDFHTKLKQMNQMPMSIMSIIVDIIILREELNTSIYAI